MGIWRGVEERKEDDEISRGKVFVVTPIAWLYSRKEKRVAESKSTSEKYLRLSNGSYLVIQELHHDSTHFQTHFLYRAVQNLNKVLFETSKLKYFGAI